MFYLLLIIPHVLAIAGLAAFAYYSGATRTSDADDGGWDPVPTDGPPEGPEPGPVPGLPRPLSADPPSRRLHVGERLAELHPPRPRREEHPTQPTRPRVKR